MAELYFPERPAAITLADADLLPHVASRSDYTRRVLFSIEGSVSMRTRFTPVVLIAGLALACSKKAETPPPATEAPPPVLTHAMPAMTIRPAKAEPEQPAAVEIDPRAARLAAIDKECEEAMDAYFAKFKEAMGGKENPSAEELAKIQEEVKEPDSKPWIARAQQLLDEDPADLTALHTIQWLLDHSREATDRKALLALIEKHHLQRPEMGDLCGRIGREDRSLLQKLVANSPHADVRGRAIYAMADTLKDDIQTAEYLAKAKPEELEGMKGYLGEERMTALKSLDAQATQQQIEAIYERVVAEFGDVKVNAGTKRETTLGAQAGSALYEIRTLAVGKPVPEIAGADLDSVAFKLSDYRGKVVLLDFWGNW
jgi:hypothetical protein